MVSLVTVTHLVTSSFPNVRIRKVTGRLSAGETRE